MVLHRAFSPRSSWSAGVLPKSASAACVGLLTGILLSPPNFRASAIVGLEDPAGRPRADALRAAAELALSQPVLIRAATRLIEAKVLAPPPSQLERLGILATATNASSRAARLAEHIHGTVRAKPSIDGALSLTADALEPAQAARVATAVAEALVTQRDAMIADARRIGDSATASRLAALRNAAALAHRRLTSLAGTDVDLAQARATAAEQVAAAEAKDATLRSILASGSPPLADSKDVPQSVETLQAAYLDQTRKLAVASETLGDRHTTIIALQDGVRHASAALTAEWKRLLRIAEADLAAARLREASIGKADAAPDAARQAAIDEARRAARNADEAIVRAENQGPPAVDDLPYHLTAPAPVPTTPAGGWSLPTRIVGSSLAALAAFGLAGLVLARRRAAPADTTAAAVADLQPGCEKSLPPAPRQTSAEGSPVDLHGVPGHAADSTEATAIAAGEVRADIPFFFDTEQEPFVAKDELIPPISPRERPTGLTPQPEHAFGEIVDDLVMASPRVVAVPTIMVASNEISSGTTAVALGLAGVALDRGMRVLLVEGPRQRPELAGMAGADCEPMLTDLFGNLRVVLQAEHADALFLAPFLKNGTTIAAALARNTQAPFLEDLASEFDVAIIDGCRAADSTAAGLTADRYLRVGRFASRRETDRFLEALDAAPEAFVGTVAGSSFVSPPANQDAWRPAAPQPADRPRAAPASMPTRPNHVQLATRPAYPRRVAAR